MGNLGIRFQFIINNLKLVKIFNMKWIKLIIIFSILATAIKLPAQNIQKVNILFNKLKAVTEDTARVNILLEIGDSYSNNTPDTAHYYYNMALLLSTKANSKKHIAICLKDIGIIYANKGIYEKAKEYLEKSLKIYEELGNKKGMAACYNNSGNVYIEQGLYDKSLG